MTVIRSKNPPPDTGEQRRGVLRWGANDDDPVTGTQGNNEQLFLDRVMNYSLEALILVDTNFCFVYANPAFTRLFGYTINELVGLSISLLEVPRQDSDSLGVIAQTMRQSGSYRGRVLRRTKDGRDIPILLKLAPIFDANDIVIGYVATIIDLAEIRKIQETFVDSDDRIRCAFDQTLQFMGILGIDGKVIDGNRPSLELAGQQLSDVLGKPVWETALFSQSAELQAGVQDAVARAANGELVRFETSVHGVDRSLRHVDFSLKPVRNAAGQIEMLIAEGHDITERKHAENAAQQRLVEISQMNAELKELNEKLRQSRSQLLQAEKMASIGVLAAGVAHEINNPMGFIQSNMGSLQHYVADFLRLVTAYENTESMLQNDTDRFVEVHNLRKEIDFAYEREDVLALLAESAEGLERVTKIVKALKDFSRINGDEQWQEEDIHEGLESALNIVWNELRHKCEVKKEYGQLPHVECSMSQLNRVFMNLLLNAAHAIETRGTITLRTGTRDDRIWIEVADTGKGIPKENIKQVFDPFFTTKPIGQGTGLGLSVSYGVIEKHHGTIEVESNAGEGTIFRIWLPINQSRSI